jgi:simple sugar transport system substrate-binding protein
LPVPPTRYQQDQKELDPMHSTSHPRRPLKKLLCAMAAVIGLGSSLMAVAADPLKVGFVYIGPIGDHGWTYQHEQGRKAMAAALGDKVTTNYVENVPEGADAERVIRNMAKDGYNLVFTTSFGYMNPTLKVAKQFPKVTFEHATGYKQDKNLGTYLAKTYEGRYVGGFLAAKMTKTKKIGYVASFPIPEVIRDIDAIQLALNKYNPGTEIKVVWVNSWFDPGKEADAANALIDQGVDVIFQHTDSPAPIQTAERRGVYSVGYASDMAHFGPKSVLTSIVNNWGPHYIKATQSVLDGTWKSQDFWGGLSDGTVELPISDVVPADVKSEAEKIIASIKSGELHPFTGPIKDQTGAVKIPAGTTATNAELASMNYYVEGITADLPK